MKQKIKAAPATKKAVEETTTITKEIIQPPVEKKPTWEIKDRVYVLKDGLSPLTYFFFFISFLFPINLIFCLL